MKTHYIFPVLSLFLIQSEARANKTFALLSSSDSNKISSYQVHPESGKWAICDCAPTGDRPIGIATADRLNCLYVSNNNSNTILRLRFNPDTGKMIPQESIPSARGPMGLCASADQKFLFCVNNESNELKSYEIAQETGALKETFSIEAIGNPQSLAVHPKGKFVFVPAPLENIILVYHFHPETGKLSLESKTVALDNYQRPTSLVIDKSGQYLIVAFKDAGGLWSYKIDQNDGKLSPSAPIEVQCPEDLVISGQAEAYVDVVSKFDGKLNSLNLFEESRSLNSKPVITCSLKQAQPPIENLNLPSVIGSQGPFVYAIHSSEETEDLQDIVVQFKPHPKTHKMEKTDEFRIEGKGEKCLRWIKQQKP